MECIVDLRSKPGYLIDVGAVGARPMNPKSADAAHGKARFEGRRTAADPVRWSMSPRRSLGAASPGKRSRQAMDIRDLDFESGFRSEKARGFESKRMEIELSVGSLDGNRGRESSQLQALHPWT